MFLSRIRLNPRSVHVVRDLGDIVELHRSVMRAFPAQKKVAPRAALGVLFRVEGRTSPPELLVQSRVAPDWSRLTDGYLVDHEYRDGEPLLAAAVPGRRLRFRLVANPSRKSAAHRAGEPPPRNSRRVALTSDQERQEWLVSRGERGGFRLVGPGSASGVRIDELPPLRGRRGGATVHVRPALFEGIVEVWDPELFRRAICDGIGPAKAYGCGLLSIAPIG